LKWKEGAEEVIRKIRGLHKKDSKSEEHLVVLLQAVDAHLLESLLALRYIRDTFLVLPLKFQYAKTRYGNVTLLSRELYFSQAVRLLFHNSVLGRHAIVVDLTLSSGSMGASESTENREKETEGGKASGSGSPPKPRTKQNKCIRIINTHLESPVFGQKTREDQAYLLRGCMKDGGVYASIAGVGDRDDVETVTVSKGKEKMESVKGGVVVFAGGVKVTDGNTFGAGESNVFTCLVEVG